MDILTLNNISYIYKGASKKIIENLNIGFEAGTLYVIIGESGSGKTTLLSLIAGLEIPTSGAITYKGLNLSDIDRNEYRAKNIGIVFQGYNLLTNATAIDNVELSMNISKSKYQNKKEFAYDLLASMGIDDEKAKRKILKLSGGEQQRVAIARAIAHNPNFIIADEPTGNLDTDNEQAVMNIFKKIAHEENKCVIVVTHSKRVASEADVILKLNNGELHTVCG